MLNTQKEVAWLSYLYEEFYHWIVNPNGPPIDGALQIVATRTTANGWSAASEPGKPGDV